MLIGMDTRGLMADRIAAASAERTHNHARMVRELDDLFRAGCLPVDALDGQYSGVLVTTTFGPIRDTLIGAVTRSYMPWRGKVFESSKCGGGNLFTRRSKRLIRPYYPAVHDYAPGLVYAYPFRTQAGPGVQDRDRTVLKIDYDIQANRFGPIRRVLDELVEVSPGYYLGKAHLRLRGRWHTAAYFTLQAPSG